MKASVPRIPVVARIKSQLESIPAPLFPPSNTSRILPRCLFSYLIKLYPDPVSGLSKKISVDKPYDIKRKLAEKLRSMFLDVSIDARGKKYIEEIRMIAITSRANVLIDRIRIE